MLQSSREVNDGDKNNEENNNDENNNENNNGNNNGNNNENNNENSSEAKIVTDNKVIMIPNNGTSNIKNLKIKMLTKTKNSDKKRKDFIILNQKVSKKIMINIKKKIQMIY